MTYYATFRNFGEAMAHYKRMLWRYGHAKFKKVSEHCYYIYTYND
jgi:hypothetical protein